MAIVILQLKCRKLMDEDNAYLLHTRKMVMQDARMTRQSAATITDMRCRWGSPTEVDAWKKEKKY